MLYVRSATPTTVNARPFRRRVLPRMLLSASSLDSQKRGFRTTTAAGCAALSSSGRNPRPRRIPADLVMKSPEDASRASISSPSGDVGAFQVIGNLELQAVSDR